MDTTKLTTIAGLLVIASLATGCNDAKACYEKGDEKACQAVCETGKPDAKPACYEIRAREVLACADGKGDCTAACASWTSAKAGAADVKDIYVAKLGSESKVAVIEGKCK